MNRHFKMASAGVAIAAAMLTYASPASAAGVGTSVGESNISETGSGLPTCQGARTGGTITLINSGTFNNAQTNTVAEFKATSAFWFNPAGTYMDSGCLIPAEVPGTLTVKLAGSNTVLCSGGTAGYQRVATDYVVKATSSACTGGTSTLAFTGVQKPCFGDGIPPLMVGPDPCAEPNSEMTGVYTQVP